MENKEYDYGMDFLKIVSMLMIIVLHIMKAGGILGSEIAGLKYSVCWSIEAFCFCSVNCFAMISGVVGYKEEERTFKFSRYIELWFQVAFYSVGVTALFFALNQYGVEQSDIIESIFPVTYNQYWYFSAYTGLFVFMPFLNLIVRKMEQTALKKSLLVCVLVFSFYGMIAARYSDPFKLENGYSAIWLILLYLFGAYIKKYNLHKTVSYWKSFLLIFVNLAIIILWFLYGWKVLDNGSNEIFYNYISIPVFTMAIGFVFFFGRMNLKRGTAIKIVSSAVFGVYLLHVHPIIYDNIIYKGFEFIAQYEILPMVGLIVLSALGIFLIGVIIDWIRILIFKILFIRGLSKVLGGLLDRIFSWLAR